MWKASRGGGEESEGEVTDMQIQDLVNETVGEIQYNLNRRLLGNHREVNKGCYRKYESCVDISPLVSES